MKLENFETDQIIDELIMRKDNGIRAFLKKISTDQIIAELITRKEKGVVVGYEENESFCCILVNQKNKPGQ